VARNTTFCFEWRVFVCERTLFVCVALYARSVCARRQSCLLQFEAAVGIVTITALHHSFKNFMMKWFVEVGLYLVMTTNAELRLTQLEKMNRREIRLLSIRATYERDRLREVPVARGSVRRMAICTTDVVAPVFTSPEVVTFFFTCVARQTSFRNLFR
jgi:hypothetical protein